MRTYQSWILLAATAALLLAADSPAAQDYADYLYVPPAKSWELHSAMPPEQAAAYLRKPYPHRIYTEFSGKNGLLQEQAQKYPAPEVAAGYPLGLNAHECFSEGMTDAHGQYFLSGITSEGALAIRLCVDLSGLVAGETLWLLDPGASHAFGPFTASDADDAGTWLPTVLGDTAVLLLCTSKGTALPPLYLEGLSHFFTLFGEDDEKALPCPISVNCETDASFQQVSTGVGLLIIASGSFSQVQCSGALIRSLIGSGMTPYLLTANHCFSGNPTASQVEVVWDYRAASCDGSGTPSLSNMPRSKGVSFLAKDSTLDAVLMRLDAAPVASLGRAWLGWDTRTPAKGNALMSIHHPKGTSMKIAYGQVLAVGVQACLDAFCAKPVYKQTKVQWGYGITENGSSGAPLVFDDGAYRVLGMLSNGNVHNCSTPENNIDNFASFRDFYGQIACYLMDGRTCSSSGTSGQSACAVSKAYSGAKRALDGFRALRDNALLTSQTGRAFTAWYYRVSPAMADAMERSPRARASITAFTAPIAAIGAALPEQ